jgi:transcriptional regulator with PAS, ATPase and Fis domain
MGVLAERREVVTVEPDEESLDTTDATERFADTLDEEAAHANIRINDMEKRLISEALRRSGGNRRIAAEQLGISDRTLYRKISEYKLE